MERYQFQKRWLSKMKNFVLIVFYFVVPFLQSPDWCVAYYKHIDNH